MSDSLKGLLGVATLAVALAPALAQKKEDVGYWQFVEVTNVEYPVEKVHRLYPVTITRAGAQLTVVAKALDGNNPKIILTDEQQVWTWTAPPKVLVPGEKLPMTLTLKLDRTKLAKPPEYYIGGGLNAGFMPPKPKDAAAYHTGSDLRTEDGEPGGLNPRDNKQGGDKFPSGTYTRESFAIVPARQNRLTSKEHPDQISFRVGGAIGNTREFNTIYEYKWVEGAPPKDRGGPAGGKTAVKPADGPLGTHAGKWEYRLLDIPLDEALGSKFEKRLAELGDEGWEVAGVIVTPGASPTTVRVVLKRPKK